MNVSSAEAPAPARARLVLGAAGALCFLVLVGWLGDRAGRVRAEAERVRALSAAALQLVDLPLPAAAAALPLEEPAPGATTTLAALEASGPSLILLNLWASWCPPCLEELPSWLRLADRAAQLGVQLVAVSYDDDWQAAVAPLGGARADLPAGVRWLRDPAGQGGEGASLRGHLGTDKLPETWVIRRGRVVGRWIGAQRWDRPEIARALRALAEAP